MATIDVAATLFLANSIFDPDADALCSPIDPYDPNRMRGGFVHRCDSAELCTPSRHEAEYWVMPHTFADGACTYCEMLQSHEDAGISGCVGGDAGKYAMCGRWLVGPGRWESERGT